MDSESPWSAEETKELDGSINQYKLRRATRTRRKIGDLKST